MYQKNWSLGSFFRLETFRKSIVHNLFRKFYACGCSSSWCLNCTIVCFGNMKMYACGCPPLWCLDCKIVCFGNIEDTSMVDLILNVVERPSGGFSAGGGISSG